MAGASTPVLVAPRRAHLVTGLLLSVLPVALVVGVAVSTASWLVAVVSLSLIPRVVIGVLRFRFAFRQSWMVRIGPEGIDWATGRHLDWQSVGEVRVYRHPRWAGVARLFGQVPDDHLVLPTPSQVDFARRARSVPTGPGLHTKDLDIDLDQLLAAVRAFAPVPVLER